MCCRDRMLRDIFVSGLRSLKLVTTLIKVRRKAFHPARGRIGRVTDCGVRGLGFKSPGSILTSRTETSSLSQVVRDGWDPCSVPLSG